MFIERQLSVDGRTVIKRTQKLTDKQAELALLRKARDYAESSQPSQFFSSPCRPETEGVNFTFVPAKFLPTVCATNKEGRVEITPLGKVLKSFYEAMAEVGIEGYFILKPGAAQEAIKGAKPFCKTRSKKEGLFKAEKHNEPSFNIDSDLALILNSEAPVQEIVDCLLQRVSPIDSLTIKKYTSNSRKTTRIEIGKLVEGRDWRKFWLSAGHINIMDPRFSGTSLGTLAELALARDSNQNFILLVPANSPEGFSGVKIDFFPEWRNLPRTLFWQRNHEGKLIQRSLKPTIIPSLETCFPTGNHFKEGFALFMHFLRTITWENRFPVLLDYYPKATTGENLKSAAQKTAIKLAREIVFPAARNPLVLAENATTMRETTDRLLITILKTLNGDPFLGLTYLGPAGENPGPSAACGMGIIDPSGLLPDLYYFLQEQHRFLRLMAEMEVCDFGTNTSGCSTLVSFLYRETGHNLQSVTRLLTPVFCSSKMYPTLVENFVRRNLRNVKTVGLELKMNNYLPAWVVEPVCF
jgi:hypothetical protein